MSVPNLKLDRVMRVLQGSTSVIVLLLITALAGCGCPAGEESRPTGYSTNEAYRATIEVPPYGLDIVCLNGSITTVKGHATGNGAVQFEGGVPQPLPPSTRVRFFKEDCGTSVMVVNFNTRHPVPGGEVIDAYDTGLLQPPPNQAALCFSNAGTKATTITAELYLEDTSCFPVGSPVTNMHPPRGGQTFSTVSCGGSGGVAPVTYSITMTAEQGGKQYTGNAPQPTPNGKPSVQSVTVSLANTSGYVGMTISHAGILSEPLTYTSNTTNVFNNSDLSGTWAATANASNANDAPSTFMMLVTAK